MKKQTLAALFALACGLSVTTLAVATDAAKSDENKTPMYGAKCPEPCSFCVESHDKAEVVTILQEHAKTHHNGMVVSNANAEAMVKTVEPQK